MKKAIIFDVDGVIIDSEMIYQQRRAQFFQERGLTLTPEQQQLFIGTNPDDLFLALFPADRKQRQEWKAAFLAYRENYVMDVEAILNPDVKALLRWLKDQGYRMAVASSGSYEGIMNVLTKNQLVDYFESVVSGLMFERSKPDPEVYRYTVAQLGLSAEECLAIEDSGHGITAARGAGIEVLALENPAYGVDFSQATGVIRSLNEVPNWLTN